MYRIFLKKEAIKSIKSQYFKSILVVFVASIVLNGMYNYTTDIRNIINDTKKDVSITERINRYEIIDETIDYINHTKKEKEPKIDLKKEKLDGFLAPLINNATKNHSILLSLLNTFNMLIFKSSVSNAIISFVATIISLLIFMFIRNIIQVGVKRYFLEQRRYSKTKVDRLIMPYKTNKKTSMAITLTIKEIYQTLWNITIIGGVIKNYEYMMIPYILAENPNIKRTEAFKLSKEMMNGYKLEAFKLDLSLLVWYIIDTLTLGFSSLFFFNPYKEAIYAEQYMFIRNKKYEELNLKELLNDEALNTNKRINDVYPEKSYKFVHHHKKITLDYDKDYSIKTYILFFFSFAFFGWLWEVMLYLITIGKFVNRGTMIGPWLPIYGFGGVLMLALLKKVRHNPILLFIMSMILAGIIEYSTAWYLETFNHMKWWDYTNCFMNLHGRICLEGLIVFGLAGATITYFVAPILNDIYAKINPKIKLWICIVLVSLYVVDFIYSTIHPNVGKNITLETDTNVQSINELYIK